MQQDPNQQQPQFPPSASNLLHESHTSQAAVAAAAAAAQRAQGVPQRASNSSSNAAAATTSATPSAPGPVLHGQHHQQRAVPQHHAYGHAPSQMSQYGHQARRSVPQQGGNAPAGYYAGYGNMNANSMNYMNSLNNMNPHAQNYINPTNTYGMAAPYQSYPYGGRPTGPGVAQNAIGTAPPIQNRDFQANSGQQQRRVSSVVPPPRRSKALAIVNPDTNEEVKIAKISKDAKEGNTNSDKATNNKNEARTLSNSTNSRKPLDVVAPVNTDATKKEPTAHNAPQISQQNKASAPANLVSDQVVDKMKTDVTGSSESAVKVASTVADNEKVPTASKDPAANLATPAIETEKNVAVGAVITENKADVNQSSSSTITAESLEPKSESATSVIVAATSNNEASPSPPAPSSPPKRVRPAGPVFAEGERRKYSIKFFRITLPFVDRATSDDYNSILLKNNISKMQAGGRQDSGRGGRGGGGRNTSGDPRGNRVLPHGGQGGYMSSSARGAGVLAGAGGMEFNLDEARSNRPPPGPKNRGNNYDNRGNRSGRNHGPSRGGQGPLDVQEKLKKSENHWSRDKEKDSELEAKVKKCRSLLNKLTIDKFDKLSGQILDIKITTPDEATAIVAEIFEKALFEPKFAGMYAKLCKKLDTATKQMFEETKFVDAKGKPMTFRKVLLKLCQKEFAKGRASDNEIAEKPEETKEMKEAAAAEEAKKDEETKATANGEEIKKMSAYDIQRAEMKRKKEAWEKHMKVKRRKLGNIQFIGALYVVGLISEVIVHRDCLQYLLSLGITHKEEDTIETFTNLMIAVGKKVSQSAPGPVGAYFERIELMSRDKSLSPRVRFMLLDLIELRNNNWVARRNEGEMKTMEEIRKEVDEEHRKKEERAQQLQRNSRGSRGGGRHHHDNRRRHDGYSNSGMTMAQSQRSQGPSRAQASLEKYANRARQSSAMPSTGSFRPGGAGGARANGGWSSVPGSRNRSGGPGLGNVSMRPSRGGGDSGFNTSGDVRHGNKFSFLSPSNPKEPVVEGPKKKEDQDCKRKASSLMNEYMSTSDAKELKECIDEEVGPANALKFTEFALKEALNMKMDGRAKAVAFFGILSKDKLITWDLMTSGFSNVIRNLNDISIDDPRASENISRYLAVMYASHEVKEGEKSGLEFMKSAVAPLFGKSPSKFVAQFLSEYGKKLEEVKGEDSNIDSKAKVGEAYKNIGFDLVTSIMDFNPMRGMGVLEDMLKELKIEYVLPDLAVEKMLIEEIAKDTSGTDMFAKLQGLKVEKSVIESKELSSKIILRAFTVYFSNATSKITEKLGAGCGQLVKLCNGDKSPPAETQMAILLALQPFLYETDKKGAEGVPLDDEYKGKKHAAVAFDALYDCDVVEEDSLLVWKKNDSKVDEGKANVLLQTAAWFKWLAEAEEAG